MKAFLRQVAMSVMVKVIMRALTAGWEWLRDAL